MLHTHRRHNCSAIFALGTGFVVAVCGTGLVEAANRPVEARLVAPAEAAAAAGSVISVERVSGNIYTYAFCNQGGYASDNCTGDDWVCGDPGSGGLSAASSALEDNDYTTPCLEADCCETLPFQAAQAVSTVTFNNVSATVKEFVWTPKLYGNCVSLDNAEVGLSSTHAWAFNDWVLKITGGNASNRYKVQAQVEIVADENFVHLDYCDDDDASINLLLTAEVGNTSNTGNLLLPSQCEYSSQTVSDYSEVELFNDTFSDEAGCEDIAITTGWFDFNYKPCNDEEFRLGFQLKAQGEGIHYTLNTDGFSNLCSGNLDGPEDIHPLTIILRLRGVVDGTCP